MNSRQSIPEDIHLAPRESQKLVPWYHTVLDLYFDISISKRLYSLRTSNIRMDW